jgi:hypothetical protein
MNVDGKIVMYPDDTCILFSATHWESLKKITELNFNKII